MICGVFYCLYTVAFFNLARGVGGFLAFAGLAA